MKMKKCVVVLAVALGLFFVMAAAAFALQYDCTVDQAGPGGTTTGMYVKLTDSATTPAFSQRFFVFTPTRGKEMLAVALTAMANNKKVRVIMGTNTAWSTITEFYLLPN